MGLFAYCQNPYNRRKYTNRRLLVFAQAQVDAFTLDNPGGAFSALIVTTAAAILGLDNLMEDNVSKLGTRKAQVQAQDAFREGLPAKIAKIYGAVIAQYGDGSPEVTDCFPN